jgi:hypothetical protein
VTGLKRKQRLLRSGIAPMANVHLTHDKPEQVLFQAVLARGDRRLAPVLLDMAADGRPWKQAMAGRKLTPEQFAVRGYDADCTFPWEIIDHGISRAYLWQEYTRAFAEKTSAPCDTQICRRCGVCRGA